LSEDYLSPAKPFYGDESGEIFETPNIVFQSPTTTERIVDTQSGFLVVVKRIDSRLALSVKRQLGTPPSSFIFLTPDEAVKLSNILGNGPYIHTDEINSGHSSSNVSQSTAVDDSLHSHFENNKSETVKEKGSTPKWERLTESHLNTHPLGKLLNSNKNFWQQMFPVLIAFVLGISITVSLSNYHHRKTSLTQFEHLQKEQALALNEQVEKFSRQYVQNLLDFQPETYRNSQIQAMAVMQPILRTAYWKETHFPIPETVLRTAYRKENIVLTKAIQAQGSAKDLIIVDVFGELVRGNSKIHSPLHLQLEVQLNPNGQLMVNKQSDLIASRN